MSFGIPVNVRVLMNEEEKKRQQAQETRPSECTLAHMRGEESKLKK